MKLFGITKGNPIMLKALSTVYSPSSIKASKVEQTSKESFSIVSRFHSSKNIIKVKNKYTNLIENLVNNFVIKIK